MSNVDSIQSKCNQKHQEINPLDHITAAQGCNKGEATVKVPFHYAIMYPYRLLHHRSTSTSSLDLLRLVSACTDISSRAGSLVHRVYTQEDWEHTTIDKTHTADVPGAGYMLDPRTVADLVSQNMIIKTIQAQFPQVRMIGEEDEDECRRISEEGEGGGEYASDLRKLDGFEQLFPKELRCLPSEELMLWIDPLDGTGEFIRKKFDSVTIMIGIAWKGFPIAGVIHQPHTNSTVWGVVGVGAYGFQRKPPPSQRRKVVTTRLHFSYNMLKVLEIIKPTEIQKCGGAGGKFLRVLRGDADAYIHADVGTKKWDSCAGDAIIRAAGGMVTDMYGNDIDYSDPSLIHNRKGLSVTLGVNHSDFVVHPTISLDDPQIF